MAMRIAIGADHRGFRLKSLLIERLKQDGHTVTDVGTEHASKPADYPDFAVRVARELRAGRADRGLLLCGSGVGVSVAANKIPGIRCGLCHDVFSARQGVEDDDANVLAIGTGVIGDLLAWEIVRTFLAARFSGAERHRRRLSKLAAIEREFLRPPAETTAEEPAPVSKKAAR
jgi:ribose 5-phosphate isomerase B